MTEVTKYNVFLIYTNEQANLNVFNELVVTSSFLENLVGYLAEIKTMAIITSQQSIAVSNSGVTIYTFAADAQSFYLCFNGRQR